MEPVYLFCRKLLLASVFVLISITAPLASESDFDIFHVDSEYVSLTYQDTEKTPPLPLQLKNITDSLSNYKAGQIAVHQVGFQLPHFNDNPPGLLRGRRVVITFPPEFDLNTVFDVNYSDTDDENDDPGIRWVFVYNQSVVVRFKDWLPGPENPHFAYLTIKSINNPARSGEYRVSCRVDNILSQTIAGPGFSEKFEILPDQIESLSITPAEDTTLTAGDGIGFNATGVDQYGNPINNDMVSWFLDPEMDPIGRMFGPFLLASKVGQGRVIARLGELEARSGLITVKPGELAALDLEIDETQFIDQNLRGRAQIVAYDEFRNIVTDINDQSFTINISTDIGRIEPDTVPSSSFVDGVAGLAAYRYVGAPGKIEAKASTGENIESSTLFWANGIYAAYEEGFYLPDWAFSLWSFYARGGLWNPGNLTPIHLNYSAAFIDAEASPPSLMSLRDCLPSAFEDKGCRFAIRQEVDIPAGNYGYVVNVVARYEYDGDTIVTGWKDHRDIEVKPFTPFTFEEVDLPPIGITDYQYRDSATVRMLSTNEANPEIRLTPALYIVSDTVSYFISSSSFPYLWQSQDDWGFLLDFSSDMVPGIYSYLLRFRADYYHPENLWRLHYQQDVPFEAEIELIRPTQAAIEIEALDNMAVNAPFVNTGQDFVIQAAIKNLISETISGPFVFELVSNGQSTLPPPQTVDEIPAGDESMILSFPVTASEIKNPAEVFTLTITERPENVVVISGQSNFSVAVIQTPARVSITADIIDHPGPRPILRYGESFQIEAGLSNSGEADAEGGSLILDYIGPGDFGLTFPDEKSLDSVIKWYLTAPDQDILSAFDISFGTLPVDKNTGQPAMVEDSSFALEFEIRAAETRLIVEGGGFDNRPLERGVASRLFYLSMQNYSTDDRNTLALERLKMVMVDRDNNIIDATAIIDEDPEDGTNFYVNGQPVAERIGPDGELTYDFEGLLIETGEVVRIDYMLKPRADVDIEYFNLRLSGDAINARIVEGPQAGQAVPVTGLLDRQFEINIPQAIIPEEFAKSFKNYPNPFNPTVAPTEIRYHLPADSDVDIYIYAATGEKVRHLHFEAGTGGGREGPNTGIYWDGRNGEGDMVLNGVYVAYVEVAGCGLTAKLKMAVVK